MAVIDPERLAAGVLAGERAALSRAITLVESTRRDHRTAASILLDRLAPHAGGAIRIGLTGIPGAGKSTLIDHFGAQLTAAGHRLAVLAVDPSSQRSGGAILGDKTRMARLAIDPAAFVRPSPTSGTLGGVAARSRETLLLCEAAGFDVVIVETVGVGQSEAAVADMVDLFVLLMLPGGGDELQGIKKGVVEIADIIAVNKADGDRAEPARQAAAEIRAALDIVGRGDAEGPPPVLTLSGETGAGLSELWAVIGDLRRRREASGAFAARRASQNVSWLWSALEDGLRQALLAAPGIAEAIATGEADARDGRRAAPAIAEAILSAFTAR